MLERIKKALRITHTKLDEEIFALEQTARAEMVRVGISEDRAASESDPLILQAVKTYCLSELYDDSEERDKQKASWFYQIDCLRKSGA